MATKLLDQAGLREVFAKIKSAFVEKETGKGLSSNDFTDALKSKLEGLTSGTEYDVMGGATAEAAGASGLVPAPAAGNNDEFLRGDGTWAAPTVMTTAEIDALFDEVVS